MSISYCKGDEVTEKVEAAWQVMLAFLLPSPHMWGTATASKPQHTGKHKLMFYKDDICFVG